MNGIDHQSPIPYYVQVKDVIRERIKNGTWQVNDQLPSEAELCEAFDVSRTVIRQALQELIHDGLIVRRKGKGSFVAPRKISESLVQKLTGFYSDMVGQGYTPVTRVLSQTIVPANDEVASHLAIKVGDPVIEIVRQRFVQNTPIVFVTTYIPYALCPKLINDDLSNQSLYALLENKYQLSIAHGRRTIQAVPADGTVAQMLEVSKGAPLIRLDSTSSLSDNTAIEYYVAYHRGDRSQFEVELIRVRESETSAVGTLPPSNTVS